MDEEYFNKTTYFKGKTSGYIFGYELLNSKNRWKPIIKQIMQIKEKGKILDIGSAYGYLLKFLPCSFIKYGIEISEDAVNIAKKECPKANIVVGDFIKSHQFKQNYFDIITAFETLEHLPRLKEAIKKVQSLLKNGGYFIASFPVVESPLEKKWFTQFDKTHINPSDKILKEIKAHFTILNTMYTFECFKFIIITRHRFFPVHHAYFIVARKKYSEGRK